jgi:bifunctional non-homologous end joining protein LigD
MKERAGIRFIRGGQPKEAGMSLKAYRKKRDFRKTGEPKGGPGKEGSKKRYIIQKHAASRLHYDLRLEMEGVLKSWAVPKGPSLDPAERRLAVQVEDHPIEYGDFEGTIPEDEYGGGTVMVWDRGTWHPDKDPAEGLAAGSLHFLIEGERLKGRWMLVRMGGKASENGRNWLLIKKEDEHSRKGGDILEEERLSVATGRSMEEIAGEQDKEAAAQPGEAGEPADFAESPLDPGTLKDVAGSRRKAFPEKFAPQLASSSAKVPAGDQWLHEIKYDGYRIIGWKEKDRLRLLTRNGLDWTRRFAGLKEALENLGAGRCILDGEIVVVRKDGTTDFQALQNVMKGVQGGRLLYYVFDLLYLEGFDLTQSPLDARKELLQRLVGRGYSLDPIRYCDHIEGEGEKVLEMACSHGLEGIVSKRKSSGYHQQRSREWVKVKCLNREEFVVVGFSPPSGSRSGFGSLLLGYYTPDGELLYAGRVGTGFTEKTLSELKEELSALERDSSPLDRKINPGAGKRVRWVAPKLVAQVEFSRWTGDGLLRQSVFKGMRHDKSPKEVVRETPAANPQQAGRHEAHETARKASPANATVVSGIRLTNPERVLYPEQGISKRTLAGYYEKIAGKMLPYLAKRPLTLVRCPGGREKECFFQKHFTESIPEAVKTVLIREKSAERTYTFVEDTRGLVSLVQMGVLEFHPWQCRVDRIERPDIMIFDLDPGPGIVLERLKEGCILLKAELERLGLESFVKTSGGKGFHVVVPLVRRSDWGRAKAFSAAVSKNMARKYPDRFVAVRSKARRKNRIFLDYLRNGRGASSIAPYSTRARAGAPVSVPIGWEELNDVRPDGYTVENLFKRLSALKDDPWEPFFDARRSITAKMRRAVGMKN